MSRIHITLQGNGGVGKSLVASVIAQHLNEVGSDVQCIDTDPVNATFAGYRSLKVQRIELIKAGKVDSSKFDLMMDLILEEGQSLAETVIDSGASYFIPLSNYLVENHALELLQYSGR